VLATPYGKQADHSCIRQLSLSSRVKSG
jgi:hypothetical protein